MDVRGIVWKSSSSSSTPNGGLVERPPSTPNCPRCGSSNTKFCYYNNYSLTQPRFFCKSCRRYWTKGGSLRNVPVGGGSRKSRNRRSSSLPPAASNLPYSYHHHLLNNNNNTVNMFNTKSSSRTSPAPAAADGPHIDLAIVYANFLNTTSSNPEHQPPPALINNNNVDPVGCVMIAADPPSSSAAGVGTTFLTAGAHDPMMQYYCGGEGGGLDSWTASNETLKQQPEMGTEKSNWWDSDEGRLPLLPPAEDQEISLFHVSPSNPHHHQQNQLQLQAPDDHSYSDLMMMFGNSSWSSFEFSGRLAAELNLR